MRKACKLCERTAMRRINRQGLFEFRVLTRLGFFPWECVFCRNRQFFRDDGVSQPAVEAEAAPSLSFIRKFSA